MACACLRWLVVAACMCPCAVASRDEVEEGVWPVELNDIFVVDRLVGHGGYGEIWAATERSSGAAVAIKVFRDLASEAKNEGYPVLTWSSAGDEGRAQLKKAHHASYLEGHATIGEPSCTGISATLAEKPYGNRICQCKEDHIDDGGPSYLVSEFCGDQELLAWLKRNIMNTTGNVEQFGHFVKMILEGLVQLHGSYVHRDLAPRNLMLSKTTNEKYDLKIIDFGLTVPEGTKNQTLSAASYTPYEDYALQPQDLAEHKVTWRDDVYALGSMAFMVLCHSFFPAAALSNDFPEGFWKAGPEQTNPFDTTPDFKARAIEHISKADAKGLCLRTMPESCRNDQDCKKKSLSLVDLAGKTMLCAEDLRQSPADILELWPQLTGG